MRHWHAQRDAHQLLAAGRLPHRHCSASGRESASLTLHAPPSMGESFATRNLRQPLCWMVVTPLYALRGTPALMSLMNPKRCRRREGRKGRAAVGTVAAAQSGT